MNSLMIIGIVLLMVGFLWSWILFFLGLSLTILGLYQYYKLKGLKLKNEREEIKDLLEELRRIDKESDIEDSTK